MSSTQSQTQQGQQLIEFLNSQQGPIPKPNLFNPNTGANRRFSELFTPNSGLLGSKQRRDSLFGIMTQNGTSVQDGNVVFSPEFTSNIDSIVSQFLRGIDSQPSSAMPPKPVVSESNDALGSKSRHVGGGGGAVCHTRPKTLADFQESEKKKPIPPKTPLTCVVCQHTNDSGTCKFKDCHNFHPFNSKSVVVKQHDNGGKKFLVAVVCSHFSTGSCKHEGSCKYAHLSIEEYEKVVAQNEARNNKKKEDSKVSPQEKPTKQPSIVPSQVRFGRPSSSSASPASPPVESQVFNGLDPFMIAGLTAVSDGLSGSLFGSFDHLTEWSNFMVGGGKASEAGSPPPRSYSPAVEVFDSKDEQGDEQGGQ